MTKYTWTIEQLTEAVKNSNSYAGVMRELSIRAIGGNYKTIKSKIKELHLDTSHFTGQGWNTGSSYRAFGKKFSDEEVFVEHSSYKSSNNLRKRLLKYREFKCECCNNSTWNYKDIPLEIHHINGDNTDNRLENLQLLCPNCHAQTPNFRGKNHLSALSEKRDVEYRKFRETLTSNVDGNPEPSLIKEGAETRHGKPKAKREITIATCNYCGNTFEVHKGSKYCSIECYRNASKGKRPSVFQLIEDFKQYKSYLQVGKHYSISDNAVRKWVKFYQIEEEIKPWLRYSPDHKSVE